MTTDTTVNEIELGTILTRQREAFVRDGPPSLAQRRSDLAKLKKAVLAQRNELATALSTDFGHRSKYETMILEIAPLAHGIAYLRRNLRAWMKPERRRVSLNFFPASARIVYQPLGVIGIISPWNYPVSLALMPLATAIAAGNRVMLKPSEFTPATNDAVIAMLRELFPAEQVAVVTGGPEVGAAFSALPFDHLVFTGSTTVGRMVMQTASTNLVPVTLELGGKSPAIVERGFSPERAAASIVFGKLANAGQTCIAPDYAIVHERDVDAFVAAYTQAVQTSYPKGTGDRAYTTIIDNRQYARLAELVEDARDKGARIIEIGSAAPATTPRERSLTPMIVLNTSRDMAIMQNEIFGPILPIVPYRDLDEAIAYVNAGARPLALYVFASDKRTRERVVESTTSGNVTINDTLLHFAVDDLPFGGIGASGIGAYHGREGFRSLSHGKGIFEQSRWSATTLLRAPFGRVTDALLRYLLR
jgi:coniferyl-aldehyde dehydrogenase